MKAKILEIDSLNGSPSVVPGPEAGASLGNSLEMQILGPIPDLLILNWKFSGGAPQAVLTSPPGDSDARSSLRTTRLR